MPRNGSGVCTPAISYVADQAAATPPQASRFDTNFADLANEITHSICTDGQSTVTANIPMSGYKLTGLGASTASGDAVRRSDLQLAAASVFSAGGTATAITGTLSPAIAAYAASMRVTMLVTADAAGGGTTLNLNGVGAIAVKRPDGAAIVANDWLIGDYVDLVYETSTPSWRMARLAAHADVPAGTKLLCMNVSAPSGYVQDTTWNDGVPMLTNGSGGSASGSWSISGLTTASLAHTHSVSGTTGVENQGHTHSVSGVTSAQAGGGSQGTDSSGGASTSLSTHYHNIGFNTATETGTHDHSFSATTGSGLTTAAVTGDGSWRPVNVKTIVITRA